ncbi:MAG: hypothetical protein ABW156_09935 [Jiangellaceae bacterium]
MDLLTDAGELPGSRLTWRIGGPPESARRRDRGGARCGVAAAAEQTGAIQRTL